MYLYIAMALGFVTTVVGVTDGQGTLGIGLASITIMLGCAVDHLARL